MATLPEDKTRQGLQSMCSVERATQLPSAPQPDGVLTTKKCNQSRNETRTKFSTVRVL